MPSSFFKAGISIKRILWMLAVVIILGFVAFITRPPVVVRVVDKMQGRKTVEDRLAQYGDNVRKRLVPAFNERGIDYPPKQLTFVGLKEEKVLQVYTTLGDGKSRLIKEYPILAASGQIGPKLREWDGQVPEGIYDIVFLNPNSLYHLSLRLNYPNEFDLKMAEKEGRTQPGKDIMIHGSNCSIGCLAMGDPASEELFVLAADVGIENIRVILSPVDFRKTKLDTSKLDLPMWTGELYHKISEELKQMPLK